MSKQEDILIRSDERLKTLTKGIEPSEVYLITDTLARSGLSGYYCIQAVEDTVFALLTAPVETGSNAITTLHNPVIMKAGHVWYIKPSAITLTSGKIMLYKL
jgi:hypothetical protein